MNSEELDHLTEEIWMRIRQKQPRALLIGQAPNTLQKFYYVNEKPYETIVLSILKPAELLHMPSDAVCDALLEGMPVYLWQDQPYRKSRAARILRADLAAAENRLRQYGVLPLGGETGKLVTAQEARNLLKAGEAAPVGCRLTPLAKDILEGKLS